MKQRHAANPPPAEADLKRLQHELEVHQAELEAQNENLRASQAELETALERYTDLYDFAPVGYLTLGPDGAIRQLNFTAATLLGAERSGLVNRCLGQFVGRADRAAFADFLESVFNGPSQACEVTLSPQAAEPPMAVRLEANRTPSGQECRAVLTNITQRKQVDKQLRETLQQLRLANDAASIGTWSWNFSDGKLEWDQRMCDWYEAAEAVQQGKLNYDFWRSRVHPDDAAQVEAVLMESRRRGIPYDQEFRIVRTDGSVRYVHSTALIEHDASGQPVRMIGINRDITESNLTEAELDKSKVRLEQLAEQSRTFTWEVNAAGLYTYVSDETERVLGYRPEELVGRRHFYDLHPETGREEFKQAAFAALEQKEPFMGWLNSVLTKDGCRLWVSTNGIPLLNPDGTLRGCQGSDTDVTGRKLAEDEVRRQAALISSLLDAIPDLVFLKNIAGVYLGCNPAFVEFVGRPKNEIVGKTDHELFAPEVADAFREEDRQMLATREPRHNEEWVTYPDSRKTLLGTLKTPYFGPDGEVLGVLGISRDITERNKAEEVLRSTLAEKTVLLKEVHHRVKNNLQVVISLLNLQSKEASKGDVRDILVSTQNRVRSMALIHENLYRSESLARLNLGSYLDGLCAHLLRSAGPVGARVRIESQVESERISIGLNQAVPCGLLINELVTNALKHAFPGERAGLIRVTFQSPTPQEVLLTVVDDGVGLPAALEPQQTESLGLQLVCLLTEQLHGTVTFERGPGTAVRILFPNPADTEVAHE